MSPPATRTIGVTLDGGRSYDVVVGAGVLGGTRGRADAAIGRATPVFVVRDANVPAAHGASLGASAPGAVVTAGEDRKSLDTVHGILNAMTAAGVERSHALLALGGGITGDVAGFAAGIYRRGIPWVNCPTTLLAMVDASVGGKTGVNLVITEGGSAHLLKNMVGVFHQPRLVVADVRTLASLPDRELRGGLAECVKHGLLAGDWGDAGLLEWTASAMTAVLARDEATLVELVARNVAVKAAVVAADERESGEGPGGGRMALNLGHTFGHALEAIPELRLSHGEAVGLGLLAAATCAELLGLAGPDLRDRLERLLGPSGIGLPVRARGLPETGRMIHLMRQDKKVEAGALRLVLPVPGARVRVVVGPPEDAVARAVDSVRAGGASL